MAGQIDTHNVARTDTRRASSLRALVFVPSIVLVAGCATHNLSPVALETTPSIKPLVADTFRPSTYGSFSVFPLSRAQPQPTPTDDDTERALLFMLRSALEKRGYRFVNLNESPDILATIGVITTGVEKIPAALDAPEPKPGGFISQPQVVATLLGDRPAASGWGTWSPSAKFESPLPGYPAMDGQPSAAGPPVTLADVWVGIIDARTLTEVWSANGRGVSRNPNPLINSQLVLRSIVRRFPAGAAPELITKHGVPGLGVEMLTNDGKHYFPTVTSVRSGSPALRGGLKRWDMVLALDAATVANRPYSDFRRRLSGESGTRVVLTVWRNGKQTHATIARKPMPKVEVSTQVADDGVRPYEFIPRKNVNTGLILSGVGAAALATLIVLAAVGM